MVQGNLWWTSTGTYWNLIQDQPIYIMVHPYTMFSRRCYWYVLVMDVHDVSAPPRHGHLVAAPLPSVLNAPMEKREFLDEHGLTTQQFWQKSSENIWKYLLYYYECSWDIHALHPREMWINKNWRSEHFRPLKRHVDNPIWQPEIRKLWKDFQTISCLSFQFNSTHKRKKWYWYWYWLQYLIPCWNEGKTCLKNKQDIIELQVCRWFRPLAITICSAYSALLTGFNVCMKTWNGLINNPTPLAFYTLMRHPKTHNASSKPVVSTVSHSGERIRITSIRQAMPGLWPTRSVCGYSKLPLSG